MNELIARITASAEWYLQDRMGSVRDVVNSAGAVIAHVTYDAWGLVTGSSGSVDRYLAFGYQLDSESGLYYVMARYMDPVTHLFLQQDPIYADVNGYRYAGNSPTNATDPSGMAGEGVPGPAYRDPKEAQRSDVMAETKSKINKWWATLTPERREQLNKAIESRLIVNLGYPDRERQQMMFESAKDDMIVQWQINYLDQRMKMAAGELPLQQMLREEELESGRQHLEPNEKGIEVAPASATVTPEMAKKLGLPKSADKYELLDTGKVMKTRDGKTAYWFAINPEDSIEGVVECWVSSKVGPTVLVEAKYVEIRDKETRLIERVGFVTGNVVSKKRTEKMVDGEKKFVYDLQRTGYNFFRTYREAQGYYHWWIQAVIDFAKQAFTVTVGANLGAINLNQAHAGAMKIDCGRRPTPGQGPLPAEPKLQGNNTPLPNQQRTQRPSMLEREGLGTQRPGHQGQPAGQPSAGQQKPKPEVMPAAESRSRPNRRPTTNADRQRIKRWEQETTDNQQVAMEMRRRGYTKDQVDDWLRKADSRAGDRLRRDTNASDTLPPWLEPWKQDPPLLPPGR